MAETRPIIELKRVSKTYAAQAHTESSQVRALDQVELHGPPGEWLAIMGPSGSGKSSMVNLIGCLDRPSVGESDHRRADARRNLRGRTQPLPRRKDRLHLPAVSPHSLSHRARKRHAGAVFPQHDRRERSASTRSRAWASAIAPIICPRNSPAANSSASALRARSSTIRASFSPTSPPVISTRTMKRSCCGCCASCTSRDAPSSWSRTIPWSPAWPTAHRVASWKHRRRRKPSRSPTKNSSTKCSKRSGSLQRTREIAEVERMEVHGALPVSLAIEKMIEMDSCSSAPHPPRPTITSHSCQSLPRRAEARRGARLGRWHMSSNSPSADANARQHHSPPSPRRAPVH